MMSRTLEHNQLPSVSIPNAKNQQTPHTEMSLYHLVIMIIGKIHEGSLDFDWGIRLIEKSNPVNMLGKIFETAILIYKHWAIMVYYEKL